MTISKISPCGQKTKIGVNVNSLEERIVELESRQAFQEHAIEELDGVIISQQQQIDRLESLVGRLQKKFDELSSGSGEPGIHGP